jgi:arginine exporter protein ArgO
MLVHLLNNGALIVLGYHGLDEAAEKLPARTELAMFVGAAALFAMGLAAVRQGRAAPRQGQSGDGSG